MTSTFFHEQFFRTLLTASALLLLFIFGVVMGYNPILGFVLMAGIGFTLAYYYSPPWFAYLYIFTVSFGALLNLPVTDGGFSSAVAIALASFGLGILGALLARDPALIRTFLGRADQILPILFLCLMFLSLMNSRAIGLSVKQIQQFFYLAVIYYFLHLTIRNRDTFRKAFFVFFLGGVFVGVLGVVEVVLQMPIYYLLGKKSLLGATVSDALLNAKLGRINGLIGDAPFHGIYMGVIALVSLYFLFTSKRPLARIAAGSAFLLSVFNVLGTGSRGALIALLLALFLFWIFAEIPYKTTIMASTISLGVVLAVAMTFFVSDLNVSRSFSYSGETSDTAEMRWKNIPVAVKMFADHPIIGNGPDGFVINYTRYASNLTNLAFRKKTLKTHDTPLQILSEYGLVGITLFSMTIFMAMKRMVEVMKSQPDRKDRMIAVILMGAIAAYIFFMATSNSLLDKYFWLLITLSQVHYSICGGSPR